MAEASAMAASVLAVDPDNVAALCCRAMADWDLGHDIALSIVALRRAVALAPDVAPIRHNLATLLAAEGDFTGAGESFEAALTLRPDDTQAFYGLATNHRFTEETPVVRAMLALYSAGTLNRSAREFLCFGLAKVYADLGNRGRAMHFCIEANWLADRPYDVLGERRRVAEIQALAADNAFATLRSSGHPSAAPLFIVGMPRSGTTLVEAILSRHPQVQAGGETERMLDLESSLNVRLASRLATVPRDTWRAEAERNLRAMRHDAPPAIRIVTDKTPDNAFRLGMIALLFPKARVVHVRRHPLDCGLSNLFTRFTAGQGFAFHQAALGERVRQTAAVMTAWKAALPLPILDLSYERLVAEPEAGARRLIAFSGLDWDPACLTPELAQRQVQTASQWQVRQKIHTESVGRFHGYEEWLAPMIEAMGGRDWIDAEFADQIK
ncbi:MAG TPA: sulfotransferase [Devosia sp.]|nr:sulfotransferase [Devosia sp.]